MRVHLNRRIILQALLFIFSSSSAGVNAQTPGAQQYGVDSSFDPSVAIVVVVVVAAFFFIGIFSIFLRQCAEPASANYYPSSSAAARFLRSRLPHGLDKSVIESFPTLDYSAIKEAKIRGGDEDELECAVCLSEFTDDQSFRLLPKCRHVFHPDCIDMWLASHVTCPVCRANLEESSPASAGGGPTSSGEAAPVARVNEIVVPVGDFDQLRPVRITGGRFPRSHSTGHSLAVNTDQEAGFDRYTLRLPEEIMREVISRERLQRAASFNGAGGLLPREWSSRKGYKGNSSEEDSTGRGGRWVVFSMTPPFVSRGPDSVRLSSSKVVDDNGDGGGCVNGRNVLASVKVPLNCIGVRVEGVGEPSSVTARGVV